MRRRWIMIAEVALDRFLVLANAGMPGGMVVHWRGQNAMLQVVEFRTWEGLQFAVMNRLRRAGLELEALACGVARRAGLVQLLAEVRRCMIRVWNLHEGDRQPWEGRGHYIGRPDPLGNPFKIGRDGARPECIEKYRVWLWEIVKRGLEGKLEGRRKNAEVSQLKEQDQEGEKEAARVWERLMELKELADRGDLNLLCHCKPLACHGDVIKACLEWLARAPGAPRQKEEVRRQKDSDPVQASALTPREGLLG
jgi:hypothetical protein